MTDHVERKHLNDQFVRAMIQSQQQKEKNERNKKKTENENAKNKWAAENYRRAKAKKTAG